MTITGERAYGYLVHDRDGIFATGVDDAAASMGLRLLKTPVRTPQANAFCERLIGTLRRECLDWLIPLNERHLRQILTEWVAHYHRGRPHTSLGAGFARTTTAVTPASGHHLPDGLHIGATPVLGGLHHEYRLVAAA